MSKSLAAVASETLQALVHGDIAALDEHPGYWQAKKYFPVFFASFADLHVEIVQQICEGDLVATRATLSGIHYGEWLGISPTGKEVRFDVFQHDRVVDGRVIEHNATADLIAILAQLGVIGERPRE
jgi:predicted ester cyclase